MRELHVGAADDADVLDDPVGLLLELFLQIFADSQHRGGAEGVAGVDADRVYVFNEADRDHVVVLVADDLQLQLLPAEDGFFDQDLMDQGGGKSAFADRLQFFFIIDEAAAGAAHGVGRTEDDRVAEVLRDLQGLLHGVGDLAAGHADAKLVHGLLEFDAVFAALDRVDLHADDLDAVFVKDACLIKFGAEIEAGLAAEIGEESVGALFLDDFFDAVDIERFDVGDVRHFRVGHDGRRIGIDEDDLVAEGAERLARLRPGIVKLTCLTDDDRAGADDQDLMNVCSLSHSTS